MGRPDIHSLPRDVQLRVVGLTEAYATPAVVREHALAPADVHLDGRRFLAWHQEYLAGLENFLARGGLRLPIWNPATAIPQPFFRPVIGAGALRNRTPNIDFSPVGYPAFCGLTSVAAFGATMIRLHNDVHAAIGGAMADARSAPTSPIFWPLHAFIDDLWAAWESAIAGECQRLPAG